MHPQVERIYKDVEARIQDVQTQLSQQIWKANRSNFHRRTRKNFEQEKIFSLLTISLIEGCPDEKGTDCRSQNTERCPEGVRAEYAARMHEDSQLRTDLTAVSQVISKLRTDNQASMTHIRAMTGMFNVIAEINPALAQM